MKTILVIEDDKALRENISDFMTEEGFRVISAEDGLVGLQMSINHLPDLILCDISMPKMNGFDFYKTIQEIKSTSTIPLIFLTARSEKEDLRTGMRLGADDYITKPFEFDELLMSIKTRIEKYEKIANISDEKFFTLIDNPLIGVFVYSENKFEFVNDTCAKLFELDKVDFLKLNFASLISDARERDSVMEKIQRCFDKVQNTVHVNFQSVLKNNKTVSFEMFAGIVSYNGVNSLVGNIVSHDTPKSHSHFNDQKDKSAASLSKNELKILALVCQGHSNSEIAAMLDRSKRTIETHRFNLLNKTGVKNTADLVMYAIRNNLI